ncbi:MAG TPA: Stp1/IreP family PP2C-type Ser/Thr phosphatase [Aggregatilinea sp.]|uniref:Stp1/IreP family PP2C-type Ser/Thr phosphatase n=1 Tax=Aggregatilinea sp. TaxID=2806333 RepID=UPI002B9E73A2|nr:Stp1/IreP family PP2C-type Ser/Thr phosphatase [Aggregatilinea sp.]HML23971.1 Stp1/IreP family PP2C-type Ser/Thr phosphatase [Aggregatilinea sp.]
MENRTCPNCGHENLPRAIFCFQCGTNLDDPPVVRGIHRQRRHVEDAMRYVQGREDSLEPDLVRNLREARAKLPPPIDGTPITCLRCGTLNKPLASYCIGCGATLSMPENVEDFHLVPRASARSDVGKLRENNEDRVGLWARHGVVLALVADGMGGAVAGEEASRLAVEAVQADFLGEARGSETLDQLTEVEVADKLRYAVRRANRAVINRANDHPEFHGMGTTLTLAFVRNNRVVIAHVGDSRAYLVDGHEGWINQITDDHSFVEALLASGHISPEQAAMHPMRNVLYRALGQVDDTEADFYSRSLAEGDRLILCSDGLTRHLPPAEIAEVAELSDDPEVIAQTLIDRANARGGEDNISTVVIVMERAADVEPEEPPSEVVFDDTEVGLFQAAPPDTIQDRSTDEMPAVRPDDLREGSDDAR